MLVSSVSLFREKRSQELLKKGLTRNNVNFVWLHTPHLKDASKNAPPTPPNKHTASASYFPPNKHTVSAGYSNLTLATKRLRKACRPFLLPWILGTLNFIPQNCNDKRRLVKLVVQISFPHKYKQNRSAVCKSADRSVCIKCSRVQASRTFSHQRC